MRRLSLAFQMFVSILLVALGRRPRGRAHRARRPRPRVRHLPRNAAHPRGRHAHGPRPGDARCRRADLRRDASTGVSTSARSSPSSSPPSRRCFSRATSTRPMRKLETAAENLAAGDLTHRVEVRDRPRSRHSAMRSTRWRTRSSRPRPCGGDSSPTWPTNCATPSQPLALKPRAWPRASFPPTPTRLDSLVEDLQHLSVLVDDLQELAVAEAGRMRYERGARRPHCSGAPGGREGEDDGPRRCRRARGGRRPGATRDGRRAPPLPGAAKPPHQRHQAHCARLGHRLGHTRR